MNRPARPSAKLIVAAALVTLAVAATACITRFSVIGVRDLTDAVADTPVNVRSPIKAHLRDGSTVIYPYGALVSRKKLDGEGVRYAVGAHDSSGAVFVIPMDSVIGVEAYERRTKMLPTVLVSSAVTTVVVAAGVAATVVLLKAIFGSCPTFYTDSAGVQVLEAEGFSYSIAPLFEARDVDRLRAAGSTDGRLTIEVRNEALETHYLNHLELLEVRHPADEFILPDDEGHPLAVRGLQPAAVARDRAGRDVAPMLRAADGVVFETDRATLAAVQLNDMDDYIEIALPVAPGADSVAVVFRLRNSLLNTVLLYDGMLGGGARSLDWMGRDLKQISYAVEVGKWYLAHMGLRIAVRDGAGDRWRSIARVTDSGPIADHDVAVVLPAVREPGRGDTVRVQLAFTADDWRIDRVAVAASFRRPPIRTIAAAQVARDDGTPDAAALASLSVPDENYLVTSPGQRFSISFTVGPAGVDSTRTFLLASQGYYTEWMRGTWLQAASSAQPFVANDSTLFDALQRWRAKRVPFEKQFFASKVPVR